MNTSEKDGGDGHKKKYPPSGKDSHQNSMVLMWSCNMFVQIGPNIEDNLSC